MSYKIVFFDVDGTLTSHIDGSISEGTKRAIRKLINRGIKVVAATGRPFSMCRELEDLGIRTFITANGAYVKDNDTVLHKIRFDNDVLKEVMKYAGEKGHGLSFYTEKLHTNGVKNDQIKKALEETLSLSEFPKEVLGEEEEVYLMNLFADEDMIKEYQDMFPQLIFKRWHPYILNVLKEDVSKSLAIKEVLDYFHLDSSEAIAFGDGGNDIDMLEYVGLGIAMGNASDTLKKIADFVTKGSHEGGIYYALEKFEVV
ncbi:Cof-type HAD-IIB family hydrolase [Mangrovibacillus cuniculi]|uniref:Cof-type HAD-IIB family hydrolase n=1 Tax=Mangrovibacillus cuniculi TaxID=2593652 RepID=A0A7S8HEL6_9BACI|nr:Cof-type HAD-IIB family hydrolase [Mangrovibacillus cuniculi]QPC45863.1 Cof-type HAD-IIB family hydrolase [Mangrovibacillus cuniculi]